jgi:hypothetical protein
MHKIDCCKIVGPISYCTENYRDVHKKYKMNHDKLWMEVIDEAGEGLRLCTRLA